MNTLFHDRWAIPFYLNVLHGNYASRASGEEERERLIMQVRDALSKITPKIESRLIAESWREAITGNDG